MDLGQVRELPEGVLVPERHIDDPVVRERREGAQRGDLLPTAGRARRDEHARVLGVQRARAPQLPGRVPEGLPLRGEVTVARRDAEDERVVVGEVPRLEDGVCGLRGRMHFGENFCGERLLDPAGRECGQAGGGRSGRTGR